MNAIDNQLNRDQVIQSCFENWAPAHVGCRKGLRLTIIVLLLLSSAMHRAESQLCALVNAGLPGRGSISSAGVYAMTGKPGLAAVPATGQDVYVLEGFVKSVSVVAQNPSAPRVSFDRVGPELVVSWALSSDKWRLESAGSLSNPAWAAIPPEFYQSNATHVFFRLPPTDNRRFFRLKFQD